MILTEIGEIGITAGDRRYKLRPSLYAMSQLGEPAGIVEMFASVMADASPSQLMDALVVVNACSEEDVSELFGYWSYGETGGEYVPGAVPPADIIHLARCLLKHGITGALPDLPRKAGHEPEYVREFDARGHASLAMAHLGMTTADAWQMTMTELVGAMRAKFPQTDSSAPGSRAPSLDEHEATLAWYERVEEARRQKQGPH